MDTDTKAALEEFLVEHVMIGLGNIRANMSHVDAAADQRLRELALGRIEGQLDHLETRARSLQAMLARTSSIPSPRPAPDDGADTLVLFHSRRALG